MRHYIPVITTEREGRAPEFLRIARAVMGDIERGRLRPGDPLPGTRELAVSLGVHRNTVLAGFRELVAQGWIVTEPARGTFVAKSLPTMEWKAPPRAPRTATAVGFDLVAPPTEPTAAVLRRGTLSLSGGIPDVRLAPHAELARAIRRALRSPGVLGYNAPEGHPALRRELARMLSASRGVAASTENVVVTRGSQMALDLVSRALLRPGDVVVVESLGYRPAWDAFRLAGARLVALPVDASGLRVDALPKLLQGTRVRAVYVTPHHQYPTTVALSAGRRLELLALARTHRFAIVEDDYDHEFHYEGRPVLPLASADDAGVVLYVGTLSKVLAPGLRIGYLVAPRRFCDAITAIRKIADRQGDHGLESAIAELLEDGALERHVRRARRIYEARRAVFGAELRKKLGGVLTFELPAGGTALWAKVAPDVDVSAWVLRAEERGLTLQDARRFSFDNKPRSALRLGFAQLDEKELGTAVTRMVESLPTPSVRTV
jgi:GntR family transcriptional regulator/MocR family aminotransferase